MTQWLSEDEQVAWRRFLHATSLLTERLQNGLQRDFGLSDTDYEILAMLSEAPNRRLRMSELAKHVLVSRSRLTYRVDQLAERGLVRRESCPQDGRGMNATLTDDGMAMIEAAAPGHVEDVRRYLFDHIAPDQLHVFSDIFARVETAAEANEPS